MERTLNIPDPQVLLHYPNDAHGLVYHHRVLVHKIGGGKWVALSPDLELAVEDLNVTRHIVLGRHAVFPQNIIDSCYIFDDLTKGELERQKRLAKTMGQILDDAPAADVAALCWICADPASSRFGKTIPDELVQEVITHGTHGLVEWEGDIEYVVERNTDQISEFVDSRKDSAGDLRTLGDHRDPQGKRYLPFHTAMTLFRESKFEDWGFSGPRATLEFLKAVQSGPGELTTYHLTWCRSSGVAQHSAIVHEHRCICEVLRLGIVRDQIDITNLMAFEHLVRRLVILEIAVSRNPSSPDFAGLDIVAEAPVNQHGSAYAASMSSWITDKLKERANIQKQARLFKEESAKKKVVQQDDAEPGGKRWKNRRPKAKAAQGGGADGSAGGQ